jgi:hypothetical protein
MGLLPLMAKWNTYPYVKHSQCRAESKIMFPSEADMSSGSEGHLSICRRKQAKLEKIGISELSRKNWLEKNAGEILELFFSI